jgi:hypothetical protein
VNSNGKIGLDNAGNRASSGSEKTKRTPLVEPAESGKIVILRSKGYRSAYEGRSNSRKVSMLLVCAAAIIIFSGIALASLGAEKTARPLAPIPQPPFIVYGHVTNSIGTLMPNIVVTVTDVTTGDSATTVTDDGTLGDLGGYTYDISDFLIDYAPGDTIFVNATGPGATAGSNTGTIGSNPYLGLDITLTAGIPEFTAIVIPIVGMISIIAVARVASSRKEEE